MIKIKSGEVKTLTNGEKIEMLSPSPCIYFLLGGNALCGARKISEGDGIIADQNGYLSIKAISDITYAVFFLEMNNPAELFDVLGANEASVTFSCDNTARICSIVSALCLENKYVSLSDEFDVYSAKMLLSVASKKTKRAIPPRNGKQHVDEAIRYIDENFCHPLRVESIADELCIDRKYLRNLFTEHIGMSTMDYIMKTRMNRAKELLETTDKSITLIANSVGYTDVLCFSKAFKKFTEVSPSDYREGVIKKAEEEKIQATKKKKQMPVFYL